MEPNWPPRRPRPRLPWVGLGIAVEQRLADLFAESGQIQSEPKFADWVDRRHNDMLPPLMISTS